MHVKHVCLCLGGKTSITLTHRVEMLSDNMTPIHRVENKNFYFDIGQNNRGVYMRIRLVFYVF